MGVTEARALEWGYGPKPYPGANLLDQQHRFGKRWNTHRGSGTHMLCSAQLQRQKAAVNTDVDNEKVR